MRGALVVGEDAGAKLAALYPLRAEAQPPEVLLVGLKPGVDGGAEEVDDDRGVNAIDRREGIGPSGCSRCFCF